MSEDFYCDEALSGRTPVEVVVVASDVTREYGACRVLTNLGRYQDSKHLHFHANSGDPL
jgi:histidine triad (HIT) family protein